MTDIDDKSDISPDDGDERFADGETTVPEMRDGEAARLMDASTVDMGRTTDENALFPQIDGYEIIEAMQAGGQGKLYKARELTPAGREVVLKFPRAGVLSSDRAVALFENEVKKAASLDHPNIARIYSSGLYDRMPFYSMEFIDGVDLGEHVREANLGQREILELVRTICLAVQHAHQRQIVHRDLKPANIMVTTDGAVPKLLDFGLAIEETELQATIDRGVGTLVYMSPEQAAYAPVTTQTDVYSLGVILYELLTGKHPHGFTQQDWRTLTPGQFRDRVANGEVIRPRRVSDRIDKELEALLLKALAHESSDRYASAGDLAGDIGNYLAGEPLTAKKPTTLYFLRKRIRKYRGRVALAAAVLVALIGMAGFAYVQIAASAQKERTARIDLENKQDELIAAKDDAESQRDLARTETTRARIAEGEALTAKESALAAKRAEEKQRKRAEEEATRARIAKGEALTAKEGALAAKRAEEKQRKRAEEEATRAKKAEKIATNARLAEEKQRKRTEEERNSAVLARNDAVAAKEAEAKQRLIAEMQAYRHAISRANLLSNEVKDVRGAGKLLETLNRSFRGWEWGRLMFRSIRGDSDDPPTLKRHSGVVNSIVFSHDLKRLALGSEDNTVSLWDTVTGKEILTLGKHSGVVNSVAFSPDGKRLASGSGDKTIKLWNTVTGQELFELVGHSRAVRTVAFSPDGKRLASGSEDKTIKLWDTVTGKALSTLGKHSGVVNSVAFSPDRKLLASGSETDRSIKLWDTVTGRELLTLKGHLPGVACIAFSPDSKRLASSGSVDKTIKLWDIVTRKELLMLDGHSGVVKSLAFLPPDGKRLASGSEDKTIKLWDTVTGMDLLTMEGHSKPVLSVAFSPGDKRLASGSKDRTIRLWKALDWTKTVKQLKEEESARRRKRSGLPAPTTAPAAITASDVNPGKLKLRDALWIPPMSASNTLPNTEKSAQARSSRSWIPYLSVEQQEKR